MKGWTKTQPDIWSRPFEGVEKVYRGASLKFGHLGKEQWQIYCRCTLDFKAGFDDDTRMAMRRAWRQLALEYPNLAVRPEGMSKVYRRLQETPSDGWLDTWLSETFFIIESASTFDDMLKEAHGPHDLPRLYYCSGASQVLFVCSHWRIDAIGTCMLLNRLFQLLAGQEARPGTHDLSPCLEDACGAVPMDHCTPGMAQYAREAIAKHHADAVHGIGLPYLGHESTGPAGCTSESLVLTETRTLALVAACRAVGVTVTAAVHAALAEVVFGLPPSAKEEAAATHFSAVLSASFRDYLPAPCGAASHACTTYVNGLTPVVQRDASFVERARRLSREYQEWHSDLFAKTMRLRYHYHAEKLLEAAPPPQQPMAPPSNIFLSSLGVVDKHLAKVYLGPKMEPSVEVTDFSFGVSLLTRQVLLYAMTFGGCFKLSVNYNEAYHDGASMKRLLVNILEAMETSLGSSLTPVEV